MNKILGLVKLKKIIKENEQRNLSLVETNKDVSVMSSVFEDFGHMDFFDSYDELQELIKDLKNNDKRVLLSMAREQTLENYFYFNYIKPKDMVAYIEKKDNRVKCTFKKSLGMKRDSYEKRNRK